MRIHTGGRRSDDEQQFLGNLIVGVDAQYAVFLISPGSQYWSQDIDAISGRGLNKGCGVVGEGGSSGPGVVGIAGGALGPHSPGVPGGFPHPINAPAYGRGNRVGVFGTGGDGPDEIGVLGTTTKLAGTGVLGTSTSGAAVKGDTTTDTLGPGQGVESYGCHGIATSGTGVAGWALGTGSGARGDGPPGVGVWGAAGNVASADPHNVNWVGLAGLFTGNVQVWGSLVVWGAKNAAVAYPDGSYRLFYSVESPESWFEDFGEAALDHGRVRVSLDVDFALAIETETYHVFLSPYGDSHGLYVSHRDSTGFEVREQKGGTSNVAFSYRVVAKRKDIAGERLAKVTPWPLPRKPTAPRP